jgi:hypothetical protein
MDTMKKDQISNIEYRIWRRSIPYSIFDIPSQRDLKRTLLLTLTLLFLVGCSPEADRGRGGGPGADTRNWPRDGVVRMHGSTNPHYAVPLMGQAIERTRQE